MPLSKDNYINLTNGMFDSTSKDDLDHMFTTLSNDPDRSRLVVHFHGGLVSQAAGMATAERLLPFYRAAGSYPVFFVWESALLEVLSHNMEEISKEKIFQLILKNVLQFLVGKLKQSPGGRGGLLELPYESEVNAELDKLTLAQTPYSALDQIALPEQETLRDMEATQFMDRIEEDQDIKDEASKIANSFRTPQEIEADSRKSRGFGVRGSTQTLMSPAIIDEVRTEEEVTGESRGIITSAFLMKHALSILQHSVSRFASRRSHGVYVTIVEEILRELYVSNVGEVIWRLMKQDAADAFKEPAQKYGGTAFLEEMKAYWEAGNHPRITLVGHSAGAVYICHFLRHAQEKLPPDVKFDVVFLAPACTFDLLSTTLETSADRINGIRIFGMEEKVEQADKLVPVVYPYSLLYFVSGILESEADMPIAGMHRFYSGALPFDASHFPDITKALDFLSEKPGGTVWSMENSGPGRMSQSTHHTDFDQEHDTMESVNYIIKQGF